MPEKDAEIIPWMEQRNSSIPALTGVTLNELREPYGLTGTPETFFLDEEGRFWFWHVGYSPGVEAQMEAEVRLMLGLDPYPAASPQ